MSTVVVGKWSYFTRLNFRQFFTNTKMASSKEVFMAENVSKPIGPYSHAVRLNGFVFTSGQVGVDPTTTKLVEGGIAAETRQTLTNLKNVLEAAGTTTDNVVKCTVFLADMNDFGEMNKVYAEFFPNKPPARSAFQVVKLPLNARVEIEAVAGVK